MPSHTASWNFGQKGKRRKLRIGTNVASWSIHVVPVLLEPHPEYPETYTTSDVQLTVGQYPMPTCLSCYRQCLKLAVLIGRRKLDPPAIRTWFEEKAT